MHIIYRGCIMIKDKKGIISISMIYSFFLVFCMLLVLIMTTYSNNRLNFKLIKNDLKKSYFVTESVNSSALLLENKNSDVLSGITYYKEPIYVKFGKYQTGNNIGKDITWKVLLKNSDGSFRLIYNGDDLSSKFNEASNDGIYVGFKYSNKNGNGLLNDSTIKKFLDNWYKENYLGTKYEKYIKYENYCSNRIAYLTEGKGSNNLADGYGTTTQYFYSYNLTKNNIQSFSCDNDIDTLNLNIGLPTIEESLLTGQVSNTYTMSPSSYSGGAKVYYLNGLSSMEKLVSSSSKVKPVINISADALFIGEGTINNPYVFTEKTIGGKCIK